MEIIENVEEWRQRYADWKSSDAPLKTGDSFELVLKFRRSGDRKVTVDVTKAEQ